MLEKVRRKPSKESMQNPFLTSSEVASCDIRSTATEDDSGERGDICQVCQMNQHRYRCPQCKIQYCSVACYHGHALSCTENFHQRNVTRVLNLEAKEVSSGQGKDDAACNIQAILQRVHESTFNPMIDHLESPGVEALSTSDLVSLLEQLGSLEDQTSTLSFDELMEKQPTRIQTIVREALTTADIGTTTQELQEWLLEPWNPWWLPRYSSSLSREQSDDENGEVTAPGNSATLDEQILAAPPFRSLSSKGKFVPLQFNLIDMLYASVWTMRLYHGVENALVAGTRRDLHQSLVQASAVLSTADKTFLYNDLSEVLAECSRRSTASSSCHVPWDVLVNDVASLCSNHRFVARCLFDAERLLCKEKPKRKLQYYVSWSLEYKDIMSDLAPRIAEWARDWSLNNEGVKLAFHSKCDLVQRSTTEASPLLIEAATKTKRRSA